jgi:PAS domain S-box-containing protein
MTIGKPRPGGAFPPSETVKSAEALRARGAELEAVIDGTPFMLARLGRDMRYRFISSAYARMIARRSEHVIGKHVADVLGQEGFAAVRPYIEKVLRGEPTEYELEIRFPEVGPRLLHGMYTPVLDAAGRGDGWIASLIDIGERRRADEMRRQFASIVDARDAMPEGGRLTISAENVCLGPADGRDGLTGEFVALRVADTGCGIPDDIVAKVCEPFFTTRAAEKGTGLGLSQVYGFARRSGGTVAIASEVGRGTTVSLYLPRSHGKIERPAAEDSDQCLAAGEETILVVEDNEDVRAVAVSLLEQLGYRTVAVESASPALARLSAGEIPDAIFTDVVLPGDMDGLALARTVKQRWPDVPTVLTTGYAKIFEAEPEFPVLRKPYQIAALARVIRNALDSTKLGRPALAG